MSETATMTPAPQRLRALERANAVRLARAELKRRIAEGEASAADIILDPPAEAFSWAIGELLMSQRRWGTTLMAGAGDWATDDFKTLLAGFGGGFLGAANLHGAGGVGSGDHDCGGHGCDHERHANVRV